MMRIEGNGERKLRAACGRCHELKNRCTRTGGAGNRCDRCERLDIECVYQTSARMGRPRVSKPSMDNSASSNSSSSSGERRRRSTLSGQQPTTRAVNVGDHVDWGGAGSSPENLDGVLNLLDQAIPPEAMTGDNFNWNLPVYYPDFNYPPINETSAGEQTLQPYPQLEIPQPQYGYEASSLPDSTLGMSEKEFPATTGGTDELFHLQCHLSNLLAGASEPTAGYQLDVGEILMVCRDLLELLQTSLDSQARRSELSPPFPSQADPWHGDQRGRFDPLSINCITVLQVATSYAYDLLAINTLKSRTRDLVLVSLGIFNIASQPTMTTSEVSYIIFSMVQQLRNAVNLLTPRSKEIQASFQASRPPYPSPPGSFQSTTPPNPVQMSVNMIREKETALLQTLSQFINNP